MENENFDLSALISKVMENPEMLQKAIGLASELKESGGLDSILGNLPSESNQESAEFDESESQVLPAMASGGDGDIAGLLGMLGGSKPASAHSSHHSGGSHGSHGGHGKGILSKKNDHKRLITALKPYLGNERSDKAELILNILRMIELAEGMGFKIF